MVSVISTIISITSTIYFFSGVDFVTPLCSQVTYEGLIDDIFNINSGKRTFLYYVSDLCSSNVHLYFIVMYCSNSNNITICILYTVIICYN